MEIDVLEPDEVETTLGDVLRFGETRFEPDLLSSYMIRGRYDEIWRPGRFPYPAG